MIFSSSSFFVIQPQEYESFVHFRSQEFIGLLPALMVRCPSFPPSSDEMHFESLLVGDVLILFSGCGGEDDLQSPFQEFRHRPFVVDFQ